MLLDSGGIYTVPIGAGPGQTGPFASFAPFALDALLEADPPTLANYFNWARWIPRPFRRLQPRGK